MLALLIAVFGVAGFVLTISYLFTDKILNYCGRMMCWCGDHDLDFRGKVIQSDGTAVVKCIRTNCGHSKTFKPLKVLWWVV